MTRDVEDAKDPKSQAIRIMYGVNRHARNLLIACDLVKQRVDEDSHEKPKSFMAIHVGKAEKRDSRYTIMNWSHS